MRRARISLRQCLRCLKNFSLSWRTICMYHRPENSANPSDSHRSLYPAGSTPMPHHWCAISWERRISS